MEKEPLVTVVTPCYNAAKYLPETIESVISQTYKNWEMIIVDDCSKDNSAEVVNQYHLKDPRVKYAKTPHNTGSPAIPRNIGIEMASGKYIALLDSDDIWYPNKLEEQVKYMEENNACITYTNGNMMDENGNVTRSIVKQSSVDYRGTLKRNELSCSAAMFRKDMVGDLKFLNMPKEDFVFWLQLMKKSGATAYNVGGCHYAYRIIANSRSRNKLAIMKQHWNVLRNIENLNIFDAAYCFFMWATRNINKYYVRK